MVATELVSLGMGVYYGCSINERKIIEKKINRRK